MRQDVELNQAGLPIGPDQQHTVIALGENAAASGRTAGSGGAPSTTRKSLLLNHPQPVSTTTKSRIDSEDEDGGSADIQSYSRHYAGLDPNFSPLDEPDSFIQLVPREHLMHAVHAASGNAHHDH